MMDLQILEGSAFGVDNKARVLDNGGNALDKYKHTVVSERRNFAVKTGKFGTQRL